MIALWSSKSKLVPDVKYYIYIYIKLTVSNDVGLMTWIFKLGCSWSSFGSPLTEPFLKASILSWRGSILYVEEDFFCCSYIYLQNHGGKIWLVFVFFFSLWVWNVWKWFLLGSKEISWQSSHFVSVLAVWQIMKKQSFPLSPTFILGINKWLRSVCSKIIARGS